MSYSACPRCPYIYSLLTLDTLLVSYNDYYYCVQLFNLATLLYSMKCENWLPVCVLIRCDIMVWIKQMSNVTNRMSTVWYVVRAQVEGVDEMEHTKSRFLLILL